jgi:hypothetical protein
MDRDAHARGDSRDVRQNLFGKGRAIQRYKDPVVHDVSFSCVLHTANEISCSRYYDDTSRPAVYRRKIARGGKRLGVVRPWICRTFSVLPGLQK